MRGGPFPSVRTFSISSTIRSGKTARSSPVNTVVEFKRPAKPPEPKKPNPGLRRLLIVLGVTAAFAAVWGYFQFIGG